MNNEEYIIRQIPDNYANGINILGMHFGIRFLLEGVAMALISFIASYLILSTLGLSDIGRKIGLCLVFSLLFLVLGIRGINDEPISMFIKNYKLFRHGRRIAYYNPRVKLEARPFSESDEKELLPKDKILMSLDAVKRSIDTKNEERLKGFEESVEGNAELFFEDDIGIVKKPKEYLSNEELASYEKKRRKIMHLKGNIESNENETT